MELLVQHKTQLQAETALASTEESLRTQKAIADHLCVECAELRKDRAKLITMAYEYVEYMLDTCDLKNANRMREEIKAIESPMP